MSDIISSLQTVIFCSVGIIASVVILWCLWKIFGFVGFPIGKTIMRISKTSTPGSSDGDNHQAKLFAVMLGVFMCYTLVAYKTISQMGGPRYSVPDERLYDIGLWIVELVLSSCGETVAVLAILSGVVKVSRLDGGKEVAVELGKDEGRMV
jgi:hypothetical protein